MFDPGDSRVWDRSPQRAGANDQRVVLERVVRGEEQPAEQRGAHRRYQNGGALFSSWRVGRSRDILKNRDRHADDEEREPPVHRERNRSGVTAGNVPLEAWCECATARGRRGAVCEPVPPNRIATANEGSAAHTRNLAQEPATRPTSSSCPQDNTSQAGSRRHGPGVYSRASTQNHIGDPNGPDSSTSHHSRNPRARNELHRTWGESGRRPPYPLSPPYRTTTLPTPAAPNRANTSGSCPGTTSDGRPASCSMRCCARRLDSESSVCAMGRPPSRFPYR